jgi:RNA polymerase sigma-70 factor (ECF subfamily)
MEPLTKTATPAPKASESCLLDADADELAGAAAGGSLSAFHSLYECFMPIVLGYTRSALASAEEAEDAAADTFMRALERLDSFDSELGSFRVWLLSIARHLVIDRRRARRAQPMEPAEIDARLNGGPAMEESFSDGLDSRLMAALGRLSPTQRQVIALRYLIGVSNEECARVLGKNVATVHQHHHMALRALASALEPSGKGVRRTQSMSRLGPPRRRLGQSFTALAPAR